MAWPIRDRATTHSPTVQTVHTFDYPTFVSAGDVLIAFVGADGNVNPAVPAGWNDLGLAQIGNNANGRAMWRKAAGSEGGTTFTVTLSASEEAGCSVWAVQGLDPDVDPPDASTTTSAVFGTSAPTAPAHTPAGGARPYVWLRMCMVDHGRNLRDWFQHDQWFQYGNTVSPGIAQAELIADQASVSAELLGNIDGLAAFWVSFTIAVPLGTAPPENYPEELARQTTGLNADTDHDVDLPAGILPGDLLLAETSFFVTDASTAFVVPAGWHILDQLSNGGTVGGNRSITVLWMRNADGSEGAQVTFHTTFPEKSVTTVRQYRGWSAVEVEMVAAVSVGGFPDPPPITPSWGTDDTMYLVGFGQSGNALGRRPALGFGERWAGGTPPSSGQAASIGSAYGRYARTPPINPGLMQTNQTSFLWVAYTVAIQPGLPPPPVPDTPINVTATPTSSASIRVDWSDVLFETGYRIERSDDGITGWATVGTVTVDTFTDTGLDSETEYCYRVVAFSDGGESDPSDVACATTFPEATPIPNPSPGDAWLRHPTVAALDLAVCVTETYERVRPFNAVQPIGGGLPTVVTGRAGGRNYTLVISLRSINEQRQLEDILAAPLVYYQPSCDRDLWMAPETESIVVTKVGRIRQTTVNFVETGPFPQPSPESIFEQPFPPPEEPDSPGESP